MVLSSCLTGFSSTVLFENTIAGAALMYKMQMRERKNIYISTLNVVTFAISKICIR